MGITEVKLVVPKSNIEQTFSVSHATRLLLMKNNGGWQLPDDSKLEFDYECSSFRFRRCESSGSEASKELSDTESETSAT